MKNIRRFQIIILVVLIVAFLVSLSEVVRLASADSRVIRDLNRSITQSWKNGNAELSLRTPGIKYDTGFIFEEYVVMDEYEGYSFEDKRLGAIVNSYVDSLKKCCDIARKTNPNKDYDKFWEEFSEPYGQRLMALYDLYKVDYGIKFSEINPKVKNQLLLQGWALEKAESFSFKRVPDTDSKELIASVKNDSGFDIEYIDVNVALYDKDGELSENLSAYAENISRGSDFNLRIYPIKDTEIKQYSVTSVNCKALIK